MADPNTVVDAGQCTLDGKADLYGLGIRIGLYLQIAAYLNVQDDIIYTRYRTDRDRLEQRATRLDQLRGSLIVFYLSTLIILARETAYRTLHVSEVYVLQWLSVTYTGLFLRDKEWRAKSPISAVLMFGLVTGLTIFFVWYYYNGLDVLPRSPCGDDYAFFFGKVSLYGWFRILMRVIYLPMSALYTWFFFRLLLESPSEIQDTFNGLREGVALSFFFAFPFCILGAELTIKFNSITGVTSVDSAGQIIPLVLGIGVFIWSAVGRGGPIIDV